METKNFDSKAIKDLLDAKDLLDQITLIIRIDYSHCLDQKYLKNYPDL